MTLEQKLKELISQLDELLKQLNGEPLTEQLPVYDAEWLHQILQLHLGVQYNYGGNGLVAIIPNGFSEHFYLDLKPSADITLRAVAKELNPLFEADKDGYIYNIFYDSSITTAGDEYQVGRYSKAHVTNCTIFTSFESAQKAISILNQIDPNILKNYFV